jgi:hypothetical protein
VPAKTEIICADRCPVKKNSRSTTGTVRPSEHRDRCRESSRPTGSIRR